MILDRILAVKREEVEARKRALPLSEVQEERTAGASPVRRVPRLHSPQRLWCHRGAEAPLPANGLLRAEIDPVFQAQVYERGGAAAMSVLTDEQFFDGSDADLREARDACRLPVLRKDFVVDPYQVWEARALGADAVLLIVRALDNELFRELHALALDLNLSALVEVHDEGELERACAVGASLIGVNNRDLDTLKTDIATTERLAPLVPVSATFVAESGVSSRAAAERMHRAGARAILVGEALMLSDDPAALLADLSLLPATAQP